MEKITFKKLYHISNFDTALKDLNKQKKEKKPGIYIWGFVADKEIKNFVDFKESKLIEFCPKTMKFIPYYVGLDSDLLSRIKSHKSFDKHPATKYTRMSKQYMLEFFKDPEFPLKTDKKDIHQEFINLNPSKPEQPKIIYYNNSDFLRETYENCVVESKKTENPINVFNEKNQENQENQISDTLRELAENMNNFWFCYAPIENKDYLRCKLEDFESLTFHTLKGKTISQVKKIEEVNENLVVSFEGQELENIFKKNNITKNIILNVFINDEKEVDFSGY